MSERDDPITAIVRRRPVNRAAARVTAPGPRWTELQYRTNGQAYSATPLPTKAIPRDAPDLVGLRCGHLTVVGLSIEGTGAHHARWVCRCACGYYTCRSAKALRNPENADDCCARCRELRKQQRVAYHRERGRYPDEEENGPI